MNSKWAGVSVLLAVAAVSGCASMSSEECANSDWVAVGYEDGARGFGTDRFGSRRKACAKHGMTADFEAYQAGRERGLVEFCQPSRGFNLGESGGRYSGVCGAALEAEFLDAYRVGYQLYSLRADVNQANSLIQSKELELERTKDRIRQKEAELISDDIEIEQRLLLLADLKELVEHSGELDAEIEALAADRTRYEVELHNYEASVAAYGY